MASYRIQTPEPIAKKLSKSIKITLTLTLDAACAYGPLLTYMVTDHLQVMTG